MKSLVFFPVLPLRGSEHKQNVILHLVSAEYCRNNESAWSANPDSESMPIRTDLGGNAKGSILKQYYWSTLVDIWGCGGGNGGVGLAFPMAGSRARVAPWGGGSSWLCNPVPAGLWLRKMGRKWAGFVSSWTSSHSEKSKWWCIPTCSWCWWKEPK